MFMWKFLLIWSPLNVCTVKVCVSVQDSHGHVECGHVDWHTVLGKANGAL